MPKIEKNRDFKRFCCQNTPKTAPFLVFLPQRNVRILVRSPAPRTLSQSEKRKDNPQKFSRSFLRRDTYQNSLRICSFKKFFNFFEIARCLNFILLFYPPPAQHLLTIILSYAYTCCQAFLNICFFIIFVRNVFIF